ncbi:MAG: hypothetical protein PVJ61_06600 [Dehalococcoidia bacterium]
MQQPANRIEAERPRPGDDLSVAVFQLMFVLGSEALLVKPDGQAGQAPTSASIVPENLLNRLRFLRDNVDMPLLLSRVVLIMAPVAEGDIAVGEAILHPFFHAF